MDSYINHFETFARARGWKATREDMLLIKEVFSMHHHFTEQQLREHKKLAAISIKKMNASLQRLLEAGMIRKIYFAQGRVYYEHVYGHAHHDHLVCMECGKIQEFRDEMIEKRQQVIAEQYKFQLLKHNLHLLGLCSDCQKKLDDAPPQYGEEVTIDKNEQMAPLSAVPGGRVVEVAAVEGGKLIQQRLSELGIIKGSKIEIITNRFAGPMICKVKSSRIALGHHLTHKIMVKQGTL